VADGVAYLWHGAGEGGRMYALRASDGVTIWSFPTVGSSTPSLVVDRGIVYLGTGGAGAGTAVGGGGMVFALRAGDGARLWSFPVLGDSAPLLTVAAGALYVSDGGLGGGGLGGMGAGAGGRVSALRPSDGMRIWSFETSGSNPNLVVTSDVIYAMVDESARGAIDTASGSNVYALQVSDGTSNFRIVDIQPATSCTQPLHGTLFYSPSAAGDPVTQLNLNLDKPQIPASYEVYNQVNGVWTPKNISNYFGHYTVSLKYGEQFTFDIDAATELHYCQFTLKMTVVDGSGSVVESIDNNGKPFRVTAIYGREAAPTFSRYNVVYLGGIANTISRNDSWVRVDPMKAAANLTR